MYMKSLSRTTGLGWLAAALAILASSPAVVTLACGAWAPDRLAAGLAGGLAGAEFVTTTVAATATAARTAPVTRIGRLGRLGRLGRRVFEAGWLFGAGWPPAGPGWRSSVIRCSLRICFLAVGRSRPAGAGSSSASSLISRPDSFIGFLLRGHLLPVRPPGRVPPGFAACAGPGTAASGPCPPAP